MRRKSSLSERPEPDGLRRLVQRIDPAGNGRGHSRVDRRLATAARAQGPWPARACANNGTCSFPASSSWRHLGESGLRENCTSRLRGGRRSALRGASSDPTPERPGNAGGGKGAQVRRGAGKREGPREWQCLGPRHRVRESWNHHMRKRREAHAGTSASRDRRRWRQGVNRPVAGCGDRREEAGGVRPPRRGRHPRTRHSRQSRIYPWASGMIPLESPVPERGTPGSVSGERKRGKARD